MAIVRVRDISDIPECVAVLRAVHQADGYPMNWPSAPEAWLTPPGTTRAWVATVDGDIVGHVTAVFSPQTVRAPTPNDPEITRTVRTPTVNGPEEPRTVRVGEPAEAGTAQARPSIEVSRLFVAPAARRLSAARLLLGALTDWAAGSELTLSVTDEGRSSAIAFYEASGWRHTHTTEADWTTPAGAPVRLRHYTLFSTHSPAAKPVCREQPE